MGFFPKSAKKAPTKDNLPQYVDSLLDAADLDSIQESESLITPQPVDYGIDKAIELLQKLPQDNASLVVAVVRETLQSANIDVERVVEDARNKVAQMRQDMEALSAEIAVLKTQIVQKETEIIRTEADLKETLRVQDLLQRAPGPMTSAVVRLSTANR